MNAASNYIESHPDLGNNSVYNQESLERFMRRTFWIFAVEFGEIRYGFDTLVYSANTKTKIFEYLKANCYSEFMILNRRTGKTWCYKNNVHYEHRLDRVIQRNQKEFQRLRQIEDSKTESPFEF